MGISAEIQSVLDKARDNTSLLGSVDHGVTALRLQIATLNERLDNLPVAPAPGLSSEDKEALLEIGTDLDDTASTLKRIIPANVSEASASGDGSPTPLAGTGAPTEEAKPIE